MHKLKLGNKIGLGFGLVILLACLLVILVAIKLRQISGQAEELATSYLPEASITGRMADSMGDTMYGIRGFALSEDPRYLGEGQKALTNCFALAREARSLATSHTNLVKLRGHLDELSENLRQYEALAQSTSNSVFQIQFLRRQQDATSAHFLGALEAFRRGRLETVREDLRTNTSSSAVTRQREEDLSVLFDLGSAYSQLRIANFKFQAVGQPELVETNLYLFNRVQEGVRKLERGTSLESELALLRDLAESASSYKAAMQEVVSHSTTLSGLNQQRNALGERIKFDLNDSEEAASIHAREFATGSMDAVNRAVLYTLVGLLAIVLASIYVAIVQTRLVTRPILECVRYAQEVTRGNLAQSLELNRSDELGDLALALSQMNRELRGQLEQVKEAVQALALSSSSVIELVSVLGSTSAQIGSTATQVTASASETASSVAETCTTIEEVNHTARTSSDRAKVVAENAKAVNQVGLAGRKTVEDALQGMLSIQQQMESIGNTIIRLSDQSQAVGEIIASVSDLAEQSNLLAVNAAIEAAKAGEQGKGFTVVAQEVKSLADQSKQATVQVRSILNDIQKAIAAAVMATEQGHKIVNAGVAQTKELDRSIGTLGEHINSSAQSVSQIALSLEQLLIGTDTVATAMENIKQASMHNVTGVKQTEVAARNLKDLGTRLSEMAQKNKALGARLTDMMARYQM